jgi:hypothetical protein
MTGFWKRLFRRGEDVPGDEYDREYGHEGGPAGHESYEDRKWTQYAEERFGGGNPNQPNPDDLPPRDL